MGRLTAPTHTLPEIYRRLGTCYSATSQLEKWEEMQRLRGLTPAREIEKSLPWSSNLQDTNGMGRLLVTNYLQINNTQSMSELKTGIGKN